MPRYFFHVFDDTEFVEDHHGVELSDAAEAKRELLRPGARIALHDAAGNMLDEQWVVRPVRGF
jgi:hypothetical protein